MQQIPGLYIAPSPLGGRGVFTSVPIMPGEIIEVCQIIKVPPEELQILHRLVLHDYYFLWGKNLDAAAIALGNGSLYNHKEIANAEFELDLMYETIDFLCIKQIEAGEEITVNYNGGDGDHNPLWFIPAS